LLLLLLLLVLEELSPSCFFLSHKLAAVSTCGLSHVVARGMARLAA
jgi:hypothetical protein